MGRRKIRKLPDGPTTYVPTKEDVLSFLSAPDCFKCEKLRSTIKKEYCVSRQTPKYQSKSAYHPTVKDTLQDSYCRSGKCQQGIEIRKELEGKSETWATETTKSATPKTPTKLSKISPKRSAKN